MSLNLLERTLFEKSLRYPWLFRHMIRRELYRRNDNDPEKVHDNVLVDLLNDQDVLEILKRNQKLFDVKELEITINGQRIIPFGTAAGMDKDCDALLAFSYVYGFQEPGTVVVNRRKGNNPPRVAVNNKAEDAYNAQGFPSEGLNYFLRRLSEFRDLDSNYPVYASICGIPPSEKELDMALEEMKELLRLRSYVQGFVWNPFSPNTEALKLLRTTQTFREHSELMSRIAPDKLRLVKMGPYDDNDEQRKKFLSLVNAFLEGGGHGIVAVNTYMVPYDWPSETAGRSGRFLIPYRRRAVRDIHETFPQAVIFATGGIFDADDTYQTFKDGATALEGYTPYSFYGLGLLHKLETGVVKRLKQNGYDNLEQLQTDIRKGVRLLA